MNTDTSDRSIVRSFFELNTVDKSPDSRKSFYRMLNRIEDLGSSQNSAIDKTFQKIEQVPQYGVTTYFIHEIARSQ